LAALSSSNATVVDCCAARKKLRHQLMWPHKNTKKAGALKKTVAAASTVAIDSDASFLKIILRVADR